MQVANQLPLSPFNAERFHGLDAARAIALFIGIFHHGIESFISYGEVGLDNRRFTEQSVVGHTILCITRVQNAGFFSYGWILCSSLIQPKRILGIHDEPHKKTCPCLYSFSGQSFT